MTDFDAARSVGRMYTAAIEQAAASNTFGTSSSSGERNRRRHEAIVQFMLSHILQLEGELESFADEFDLSESQDIYSSDEQSDTVSRSRFDHIILADDGRPVAIIEDKIDAALGQNQLERYVEVLAESGERSDLMVLHPARRQLVSSVDLPRRKRVRVRFLTWHQVAMRMAKRTVHSDRAVQWRELAEFAENVGTGDLTGLPAETSLLDQDVACEVRNIILSGQKVAYALAGGRLKQMSFSMHPGNQRPWLQAGLTNDRLRVGLEMDVQHDPGTLFLGVRGYEPIPTKIGYFAEGRLTAAASRRVEMVAEVADAIEEGDIEWPPQLRGRRVGKEPTYWAMDALQTLAAVFQASSLRNPHRGVAIDSARSVNEGEFGERLGVRLKSGSRNADLFIGPPVGQEWTRASIWIRSGRGDFEVVPHSNETGRDYVLRVWGVASDALSA